MLVVRHEVFLDHSSIGTHQVLHRMWHSMRSQVRSHVGVENAEFTNRFAALVGEQRISDRVLLRKRGEDLL